MAKGKETLSKHNNFSVVRKIGITFIIPIFLAILGVLLFLIVGWNYISTSVNLGSVLFEKDEVNVKECKYEINNKEVTLPKVGEKFATLKIDSIGLNSDIYEGDDEQELSIGIGHNMNSAFPGEGGNVVLCAHRDGFFAPLQYIKEGDKVSIVTGYGTYIYEVNKIWVTNPEDMTVTEPSDYEMLTMYTCYPFNYIGSAPQRYIVQCKFIKVES